ncbi:MAG: potassium-transporting ATPase subunit C, partial [Acinetobacter junii]|nr:potassium-transporting ATPase subunit C [Acinetobacter junii]
MATIRKSVGLLIIVFVLCGFIFPLTVTAIGQVIFPHQANGSLIKQDGKVIGSELIGQQWTATKYFHGRISAVNYNMNGQQLKANKGPASGGSNLANSNPLLKQRVEDI